MAFTPADLAALDTALKSGARSVKYEDRLVEYRSLAEMMQLRNLMRLELGLIDGGLVQHVVQTNKNLGGPGTCAPFDHPCP